MGSGGMVDARKPEGMSSRARLFRVGSSPTFPACVGTQVAKAGVLLKRSVY